MRMLKHKNTSELFLFSESLAKSGKCVTVHVEQMCRDKGGHLFEYSDSRANNPRFTVVKIVDGQVVPAEPELQAEPAPTDHDIEADMARARAAAALTGHPLSDEEVRHFRESGASAINLPPAASTEPAPVVVDGAEQGQTEPPPPAGPGLAEIVAQMDSKDMLVEFAATQFDLRLTRTMSVETMRKHILEKAGLVPAGDSA